MAKQHIHGVWIRADSVERTSLEESQTDWDSRGTVVLPLAPGEDDQDSETDPVLDVLRSHSEDLDGEYAVALPMGRAVVRVVELPTTESEEIDAMVSLQVDKFSPFPVEQLRVTYERLSSSPNGTRVLVVAFPHEQVDEVGQLFSKLKRYPKWVDVDVLGWWWLIRQKHPLPATGQDVVFIINEDDTFLIIAADGVPTLFRALGPDTDMSREAYCEMLVEETAFTVTSLETEWGTASGDARVTIWHAGDEPTDLVDAMRKAWETDAETRPLDDLGPLSAGLAWRAAHREDGMANLASPQWILTEQARKAQMTFLIGTVALLGCWAIILGGFLGALAVQKARLAGLRDDINGLAGPVAEIREMREKAEFLEKYMDARFSALESLRAVSVALPPGVDLSQMTYAKGGTITIRGTAGQREPVYEFYDDLERSDLFHEVKLGKVDVIKGKNVFRLTAESGGEEI